MPTDDAPRRGAAPPPWWRTPWWRGTRERKALLVVEVIMIGLIGGWLGLLAGGTLDAGVGPLRTHLSVQPSVHGGSVLSIPPLGELRVRTHAGPWRLNAEVTRIDAADARRIFSDPASVNGLGEKVAKDLTGAVITVAIKAAHRHRPGRTAPRRPGVPPPLAPRPAQRRRQRGRGPRRRRGGSPRPGTRRRSTSRSTTDCWPAPRVSSATREASWPTSTSTRTSWAGWSPTCPASTT